MSWKCLKVKNKSLPTAITRKHLLAQEKKMPLIVNTLKQLD